MPDGRKVELYTLTNSNGLRVSLTNYGAITVSVEVPDRDGKLADVTLGYDTLDGWLTNTSYFGATVGRYADVLRKAATIVWNGPLGMYEVEPFHRATLRIAEEVAAATKRGAMPIIGGGDTVDFHVRNALPLSGYTFVSTGGGAMLEFISGKPLPALAPLRA